MCAEDAKRSLEYAKKEARKEEREEIKKELKEKQEMAE